jgi:hypothetical protein
VGKRIAWSLPSVVLCVAACSSGAIKLMTVEEAAADLASSVCSKIDSCAHIDIQVSYGDVASCTSRYKPKFSSAIAAKGSGTSADNVEACARGYRDATCADLIAGSTPAGCDIHGSLMPGAPCGDDVQCSGANGYCNIPPEQACGVCATRAAAGSPCLSGPDCQSSLVCGFAARAPYGSCVTPSAAGASCDGPHPCRGGLACVNATCSP